MAKIDLFPTVDEYAWANNAEKIRYMLIAIPVVFYVRAMVLAYGWNTFVVAATNAPPITGPIALGLSIIVALVTKNPHIVTKRKTINPWDKLVEDVLMLLFAYLLLWAIWAWFVA